MKNWIRKAAWGLLLWAVLRFASGVTYPANIREALGSYIVVPYTFQFAAADDDAAMGDTGVGSTVLSYVMPFAGWVVGQSTTSVTTTLAAAVFLIHLAGSAVAALTWTVNGVQKLASTFNPTEGQFAANDLLAVEVDSVTTMDETTVVVYVAFDISDAAK